MSFLTYRVISVIFFLSLLLIPAVSQGLTVANLNDDLNLGSLRHAVTNTPEAGTVNKKYYVPITSESKAFKEPVKLSDCAVGGVPFALRLRS